MTDNQRSRPLVSIVIPTYNQRPEFLRASIESALAQTYPNVEVVVSDNHSTNEVPEILREYAAQDARVRVVKPPEHLKLTSHFDFAVKQSRGDIFGILSSDDLLKPDAVAVLAQALLDYPEAVLAYGEIEAIDAGSGDHLFFFREMSQPSGLISQETLYQRSADWSFKSSWMVGGLVRKPQFWAAGGMDQGCNYASDMCLTIKLIEMGGCAYANVVVGQHRIWRAELEFQKVEPNSGRIVGLLNDYVVANEWRMAHLSQHDRPLHERVLPAALSTLEHRALRTALVVLDQPALVKSAAAPEQVLTLIDRIPSTNYRLQMARLLLQAWFRPIGRWTYRRFKALRARKGDRSSNA